MILDANQSKFTVKCDKINIAINNHDDPNLPPLIDSNYYDIKEFNACKIDKLSSFGFIHINIASLNKHIDDLKLILSMLTHEIDVIGISEHKIQKDNDKPAVNIKIPGYQEFLFQPIETTHGGTGFYLKDQIDYIQRTDLDFNSVGDFESLFVEIKFPKKKNLVIGCIYRHPTSKIPIQEFNQCFVEPLLQKINSENKQCILMGDFNIDLLKCESHEDSNAFLNNLSSSFFTPYVLQPTRLASKTLIDNIFFNSLEYQSYSGNILIEIADHLIQFLILEGFVKERTIPKINLFKRDFSNFNDDEFKKAVNELNWVNIVKLDLKDPNISLNNFYKNLTFLLDEFAPYKKVSKKEYRLNFKPWITTEILNLMKQRDKLLKRFSQEDDPIKKSTCHTTYKQLRNLVTQKKNVKASHYIILHSSRKIEENLLKFGKESEI